MRSGDVPGCLHASCVDIMPARGIAVEEDPAAGATTRTRGAAHLTLKGSRIGADHRPRGIPDSETGVTARASGDVLQSEFLLGPGLSDRDHRRLLLGDRRTSYAEP